MLKLLKGGQLMVYPFHPQDDSIAMPTLHYLGFLSEWFDIQSGVTFSDFLKPIFLSPELYAIVFGSQLGYIPLDSFASEYQRPVSTPQKDIDLLRIGWTVEIEYSPYYKPKLPGLLSVDLPYTFINTMPIFEGVCTKTGQTVDISYSPLNDLNPLPMKLDPMLILNRTNSDFDSLIQNAAKPFTVYDVLNSVFTVMAYHGSPETRMAEAKDLERPLTKLNAEYLLSLLKKFQGK